MDGWTDGWTDGQMKDGWMGTDGWVAVWVGVRGKEAEMKEIHKHDFSAISG